MHTVLAQATKWHRKDLSYKATFVLTTNCGAVI